MEKKAIFGGLSLISFVLILFTPIDSKLWVYLLILGVVFGIGWFKFK
jgi:hypothetical protein